MPKPKKSKLCRLCEIAHETPNIQPTHLVHPVTGAHMLFDVRSQAVCPECGARWHRTRSGTVLVE